jgi:transcriptional regulator with XRE-family HTH domain
MSSMTEQVDYAKEPELTLGWRIQMALDKGGLRHTDVMDKFEVSRQTVSRWCRDVGAAPKKYVLNEIAVMCGVPPRWLIDGVSSTVPPDDGGPGTSKPVGYLPPCPATCTDH